MRTSRSIPTIIAQLPTNHCFSTTRHHCPSTTSPPKRSNDSNDNPGAVIKSLQVQQEIKHVTMAPGLRHPVMAISINTNPNLLQNLCILCRREFVCSFPKALSFTERKSTIGRGRYHSSLRCRSAGLSARVASIAFGDGSCVFAFGGFCVPSVLGRALPSFDSTSRAQPNPDTQPRNTHTQRVPHPVLPGVGLVCCVVCLCLAAHTHRPQRRSLPCFVACTTDKKPRKAKKIRLYIESALRDNAVS